MPAGLEIYGPDGTLWVGVDDYVGKVKGVASYAPPAYDGPDDVTVSAPGAAALNSPFLVFLDISPRSSGEMYQQSGIGVQIMEGLPFTSAYVRTGYNEIIVRRYWSVDVWYGFDMLYGER